MAIIFGLWMYYEFRDRKLYSEARSRVLFHCIKCGHLYSMARGTEFAVCPKCGFENTRLKF